MQRYLSVSFAIVRGMRTREENHYFSFGCPAYLVQLDMFLSSALPAHLVVCARDVNCCLLFLPFWWMTGSFSNQWVAGSSTFSVRAPCPLSLSARNWDADFGQQIWLTQPGDGCCHTFSGPPHINLSLHALLVQPTTPSGARPSGSHCL